MRLSHVPIAAASMLFCLSSLSLSLAHDDYFLAAHRRLTAAALRPDRRHTEAFSGVTPSGGSYSISSSFDLHDHVSVTDEGRVLSSLSPSSAHASEEALQRLVRGGEFSLTYEPPTGRSAARRLSDDKTLYCDHLCQGYSLGGEMIIPDGGLSGDVLLPTDLDGNTVNIGDYQACKNCVEYSYSFDSDEISDWTVFNYDKSSAQVVNPRIEVAIPKVEGTTGGGRTTLAVQGLACVDCYAYLSPKVSLAMKWTDFYVSDFEATLSGSSYAQFRLELLDPVIAEIGDHLYTVYRDENFTHPLDFYFFDLLTRKTLDLTVSGHGRARGSGHLSAAASVRANAVSGYYKKFSASEPPIWASNVSAAVAAGVESAAIDELDLGDFGVDVRLSPRMDMKLVGKRFPFIGLTADATAMIEASAGLDISAKRHADVVIEIEDDVTLAGTDLSMKLKWYDALPREDVISVFMHNYCWGKTSTRYQILRKAHAFRSKKGELKLAWTVPYDARLAMLVEKVKDDPCSSQFFVTTYLESKKMDVYRSGNFTLQVNEVQAGYGVNVPGPDQDLFYNEYNSFEWNERGYSYFQVMQGSDIAESAQLRNVSVYLYAKNTDCLPLPVLDNIFDAITNDYNCGSSWTQVVPYTPNVGSAELFVPATTLNGLSMRDFNEVYSSVVGVENTDVYSRNRGSFKVYAGCNDSRFKLTFEIVGETSMENNVWFDVLTGWYWDVTSSNSATTGRQSTKSKDALLGSSTVDWGERPSVNRVLIANACKNDVVSLKTYELDDPTFLGIEDDEVSHTYMTSEQWAIGENGSGDGVWRVNLTGDGSGSFPLKVTVAKVSQGGRPYVANGGTRKTLVSDAVVSAERPGRNLRDAQNTPDRHRRLEFSNDQDCISIYYHVEACATLTSVIYDIPIHLAETLVDPVTTFLGYEEIRQITLYKMPEPYKIDILPYREWLLANATGFDCSSLIDDRYGWDAFWADTARGSPGPVAAVTVGAIVVAAGTAYAFWAFFVGGGASAASLGLFAAMKNKNKGGSKMNAMSSMPARLVGQASASNFEVESPMAKVHAHARGEGVTIPPPPPPPPPAREPEPPRRGLFAAIKSGLDAITMRGSMEGLNPTKEDFEAAMQLHYQQQEEKTKKKGTKGVTAVGSKELYSRGESQL